MASNYNWDTSWSDLPLNAKLALTEGERFKDDLVEAIDKAKPEARRAAEGVASEIERAFENMAKRVAGFMTLDKMLGGLSEAIKTADQIRDITAAVAQYTGSVESASRAMAYFRQQQESTRATSLEMLRVYRDLLPHFQARGFSQDTAQQAVADLARLATVRGLDLDKLQNAMTTVLAGRIIGGNPLLKSIGMLASDVRTHGQGGGLGSLDVSKLPMILEKMHEMGKASDELGDSFESMSKKVKINLLLAFSDGFNEARGNAQRGMDGIKKALNDPDLIAAARNIGRFVADAALPIANAVKAMVGTFYMLIGGVQTTLGLLASGAGVLLTILGSVGDKAKSITDSLGTGGLAAMSLIPGGGLGAAALQAAATLSGSKGIAADIANVGFQQSVSGADKVRTGMEMISAAAKSTTEYLQQSDTKAKGFAASLKTGEDNFAGIAGHAGKTLGYADRLANKLDEISTKMQEGTQRLRDQAELVKARAEKNPFEAAGAQYHLELDQAGRTVSSSMDDLARAILVFGPDNPKVLEAMANIAGFLDQAGRTANSNLNARLTAAAKGVESMYQDLAKVDQATLKAQKERYIQDNVEASRIALDRVQDRFVTGFAGPLRDALLGASQEGGRGFARAFASAFQGVIDEGASGLIRDLTSFAAKAFGGRAQVTAEGGRYKVGDRYFNTLEEANRYADMTSPGGKALQAGAQIAGAGLSGVQAGFSGVPGSRTASLFGAGIAAASIASAHPVVAAAMVIANIIGSALGAAQRQADYQYARPMIGGSGQAYLLGMKNLEPAAAKQMLERVQDTFDTFWNGYVNLMLKFPGEKLVPALKAIDGKFQDNPSGHFMEHFDQWLTDTLPTQVAGQFKEGMQKAYTGMGMSVDKFNSLWDKFDKLAPQKRLDLWNSVADTFLNMQKVRGIIGPSIDPSNIYSHPGAWDPVALRQTSSGAWLAQLTEGNARMTALAGSLSKLTGEAQINAANELSTLMLDKAQKEKAALIELANLAESIGQQFQDAIGSRTVAGYRLADGSPDYQAQADYWRNQADKELRKLPNLTDPKQIQDSANRFISYIGNAEQAFAQLGPDQAEAIRKWAIAQLEKGSKLFDAQIDAVGKGISNEARNFFDSIKGPFDDFATKVTDTGSIADDLGVSFGDLGGEIDGAIGHVKLFSAAIGDATNTLVDMVATLGGGDSDSNYAALVVANRA